VEAQRQRTGAEANLGNRIGEEKRNLIMLIISLFIPIHCSSSGDSRFTGVALHFTFAVHILPAMRVVHIIRRII
jgi:hypothetical protein